MDLQAQKTLNQISILPSKRDSFSRNTFLETAITEENIGVVVEELVTRTVEGSGIVSFSGSQTNSVGDTLTERASGDLNTGSVVSLGVTRSTAVDRLRDV